jgi:hypothetical protein
MDWNLFAYRNVADKVRKMVDNPDTLLFYWQTYALSQLDNIDVDVYMVSYPKCGRTWQRVMLQQYLQFIGCELRHYNDKSLLSIIGGQNIKFEHDQSSWIPAPPPLENIRFNAEKYGDKKVTFLVRDPRDALVSSWYHLKYRENIYRGSLSEFIRDDLVGVKKVVRFTNVFIENMHNMAGFHLMTYEDLHRDPSGTFMAMLAFMSLPIDADAIQKAVAASSFENMKKMESSGELREPWMKPGGKNDNAMKIRKGKVGGFKEEFTPEDVAYLDEYIGRYLTPLLPQYQRAL